MSTPHQSPLPCDTNLDNEWPPFIQTIAQPFRTLANSTSKSCYQLGLSADLAPEDEVKQYEALWMKQCHLFKSAIDSESPGSHSCTGLWDTKWVLLISHMMRELIPGAEIFHLFHLVIKTYYSIHSPEYIPIASNMTSNSKEPVAALSILTKKSNEHGTVLEQLSNPDTNEQSRAKFCFQILFTGSRDNRAIMENALHEHTRLGCYTSPTMCLVHSELGLPTEVLLGWIEEKSGWNNSSHRIAHFSLLPMDASISSSIDIETSPMLRIFLSLVRLAEHAKTTSYDVPSCQRGISMDISSKFEDDFRSKDLVIDASHFCGLPPDTRKTEQHRQSVKLISRRRFGMKWLSQQPNKKLLSSDVNCNTSGGKGVAEWLLDHYVCVLPSPSNCVGIPEQYHKDKKEQILSLVNDTSGFQPWVPSIAFIREVTLLSKVAETHFAGYWKVVCNWNNVFMSLRSSSHDHGTGASNRGCYFITKCHINYLRSLEYDQCVRSHKHLLGRGSEQSPTLFETTGFDPRPFALIFKTLKKHSKAMGSINDHIWPKSDDLPRPEIPNDRALRHTITCGRAMYQDAARIRNTFSADNSHTVPMESKISRSKRRGERVRDRMLRYPVEGRLDGSVTIAIPGFLSMLLDKMDGAVNKAELSERFMFFKNWEGDLNSPQPRDTLHLPILLINHQHGGKVQLDNMTVNAQRLACVSAAGFLEALGIKDFPIYGLVTYAYGRYSVVSQVWYSNRDHCCYAMDGVTPKYQFDLCKEDDVVRLMNFRNKLEQHGRELQKRFEDIRNNVLKAASIEAARAVLWWTVRSQLNEDHPWEVEGIAEALGAGTNTDTEREMCSDSDSDLEG